MKRDMTLSEIQAMGLDIMKDIHAFCMEHHIQYSLAYGSMIGAVRHQGFIPWDDDIDIWMTRKHFELFSATFKSRGGFKLMSVYDQDNYCNYTRVYDTEKTLVISPVKACKHDVGVWVDVFPIDGISDNDDEFKAQYAQIRTIGRQKIQMRYDLKRLDDGTPFVRTRMAVKMLLWKLRCGGMKGLQKRIISLCKQYDFDKSKRCASLVCGEAMTLNKPEVFSSEDFASFQLMSFETEQFMVSESYDRILTTIFGNYMQLPPEEKRKPHSLTKWHFYWK